MSIKFAARLCTDCYNRKEDADRADIWIGMSGILESVKNNFFSDYGGGDPDDQYYVEAMRMLDDLHECCDDCGFRAPLIQIRVKEWLNNFTQMLEILPKEKGTQQGKVFYPKKFQHKE